MNTVTIHRFHFDAVSVEATLPDVEHDGQPIRPHAFLSYHPPCEAAFRELVDRLGGLVAFDPIAANDYPRKVTQTRDHHGVQMHIHVYLPYDMERRELPRLDPVLAQLQADQQAALDDHSVTRS